ncbi:MAG TPA: hypothetical protein VGM82_05375 [Gemmatimonadaceae bacterium]|jgi:hypothetical protein
MQKILLISIWLVTIFFPFIASRDPSPRRALRWLLTMMGGFVAFYVFALIYILPRLPA